MTSLSCEGAFGYISAWPEGGVKTKGAEESTGMGVRARDWVPRVHPETGVQQVEGKWVAATPDDSLHYFTEGDGRVSEVGSRIIALIDGQRTVGQIIDLLCEEFEVRPEECEREVVRFVDLLVEKRVLSP